MEFAVLMMHVYFVQNSIQMFPARVVGLLTFYQGGGSVKIIGLVTIGNGFPAGLPPDRATVCCSFRASKTTLTCLRATPNSKRAILITCIHPLPASLARFAPPLSFDTLTSPHIFDTLFSLSLTYLTNLTTSDNTTN
jgi:hypothetical protein